jgi:hypothetical protein
MNSENIDLHRHNKSTQKKKNKVYCFQKSFISHVKWLNEAKFVYYLLTLKIE